MRQLITTNCFFLAVICISFSTSCTSKQEPNQEQPAVAIKGRIGVTCMDLTNPFFKLIGNIMEQEAARHGYEMVVLSGDNDAARQNNQLSDFVAQGYDAIFLNPVDSKSAGEGVKKAAAAGIPVFTFDVQVTDKEANKLVVSHIGSDNYQGGLLAGESMMEVTGDNGQIAIIGYPEITSCIYRVDGFKDYLKENNSKLQIVTELSGRGSREGGLNVASDLLQAHPDIVGIFAINDPTGLGAYSAVQKANKTSQIAIVAFDAHLPPANRPSSKRNYLTRPSNSLAKWPWEPSTRSSAT